MFKCNICDSEWPSLVKMIKHVNNKHKIKTTDYYDKYLKRPEEGICVCGSPTKFSNVTNGYRAFCSKKCACTTSRESLKADHKKFQEFKNKVSKNMQGVWADRKRTGNDGPIRNKISETITINNSLSSKEEMKVRYGWLNKLTESEKEKWKNDTMIPTGAHKWWKTANEFEKREVYLKRLITRLGGAAGYEEFHKFKDEFLDYSYVVRLVSERTYRKYKDFINPDNFNRGVNSYHLDHICSIRDCFDNNIPVEVAASKFNLRIITSCDNLSKHAESHQTPTQLMEKFNGSAI